MRLGFVVNKVADEQAVYTTTRLAMSAVNRGHEAWLLGADDFVYLPDGSLSATARSVKGNRYENLQEFLSEIQGENARREKIELDDFDILLHRGDPSIEVGDRSWAQSSPFLFGQLAAARGVIVLNDPVYLANAINKTYFQHFPEEVRPKTCISRSSDEIKNFIKEQGGHAVIKPLQGSGGQSVFLIRPDDAANLNQMIAAVTRDGYCIAQEYLPAAEAGDVRLFVMNGYALERNGKFAAFRRVNQSGDMRSNMHSGGKCEPATIGSRELHLVDLVRPRLIANGMWLVGLDIVDDKLMEINVFSPGGLGSARQVTGIDFTEVVMDDLEWKVAFKAENEGATANLTIATIRAEE